MQTITGFLTFQALTVNTLYIKISYLFIGVLQSFESLFSVDLSNVQSTTHNKIKVIVKEIQYLFWILSLVSLATLSVLADRFMNHKGELLLLTLFIKERMGLGTYL